MIDVRRLSGTLLAVAYLLLCLAVCECALATSQTWWPTWLKNDWAIWQLECYQRAGPQISELLHDGLPEDRPLALLLGSSSQNGIDPNALNERLSLPLNWFRLLGYGAHMCELEENLSLILSNHLRPAVVVLAIELGSLSHPDDYIDTVLNAVPEFHFPAGLAGARLRPSVVMAEVVEPIVSNVFNRCFPRRVVIWSRLWSALTSLRLKLLGAMGQSAYAVFRPRNRTSGPQNPPTIQGETASAETMAALLRNYREKGEFRPDSYKTDNDASLSLMNIIKMARSIEAEVVIVVLPVNSVLRAKIPSAARQTLFDVLRQSCGTAPAPVIELMDTLGDDEFFDFVHANSKGKLKLTQKVIDQLSTNLRARFAQ